MEREREVPAYSSGNMIYIASDARKNVIILLHLFLYVTSFSCQHQLIPAKEQELEKNRSPIFLQTEYISLRMENSCYIQYGCL